MKVTARWLANHSLELSYKSGPREGTSRVVLPEDSLTLAEAAAALDTYPEMLRRLISSGRVETMPRTRPVLIPMAEVYRLRRWQKQNGKLVNRRAQPTLDAAS